MDNSEHSVLFKFLESNEKLLSSFDERLKKIEESVAVLREKSIYQDALSVKERLRKADDKISVLENEISKLKVYGVLLMTGITGLISSAINFLWK